MHRYTALTALLLLGCGDGGSAAPPPLPAGVTAVAAVQGSGSDSPLVDQTVTVNGVVSGDFQDNDADTTRNLGGFYLLSLYPDDDPQTSDGIFIFDGPNPAVDVAPGNVVSVTGKVQEFFGETQIEADAVAVEGNAIVQAVPLSLPAAASARASDGSLIADLEAFEGMLVRIEQPMSISGLRELERFGAMRLSADGRLQQFTNGNAPDATGYTEHRDRNARRTLVLDDGQRAENPWPLVWLESGPPRAGDTLSGIVGNLRYSRGSGGNGAETWRLMPTETPAKQSSNPRPSAPSPGGSLRVASLNVLNYFSTVDNGRPICGPRRDQNCRGADSRAEQRRQLDKIVSALTRIDADIVGLMELENNASESLSDIVDALNAKLGAGTYRYLNTGTIGDDVIKTGFIYQAATVEPIGDAAILDDSVDPAFNDDKNRPALAQTFAQTTDGAALTVVVNHLKSKGSDCNDLGDPNTGDGQGNCNRTRTAAVEAMTRWLAQDPTGSGDPDILIIGDLNAYLEEDPLRALDDAGYTNLVPANGWSYVFDAQAGALDHALASPELLPQIAGSVEWHINADEAPIHDYNLEHGRNARLFDGDAPWRASDHDPLVIGIELK